MKKVPTNKSTKVKESSTDCIDSLLLHSPGVLEMLTFENPILLGQVKRAIMHYAAKKSQHYAEWIAEQVVSGRTYDKLWKDYLNEHPLE